MSQKFRLAGRFVIINEKNEILIVRQKNNWAIPWWWIDYWENLDDNIKRESEEELWIKAQKDKIIFSQDFISSKKNKHCFEFFCTIKNNDDFKDVENSYKKASHSYELKKIKWVKLEDFPENFKPKIFKKVLKKYLNDRENFFCEYISWL